MEKETTKDKKNTDTKSAKKKILVLGCGIIGLTTSILLQKEGFDVTIWAKDFPPNTTSNKAAAVWYPFLASPPNLVSKWCKQTYSYYRDVLVKDPESGVMAQVVKEIFRTHKVDPYWIESFPGVLRRLKDAELPPGFIDGWLIDSFVINSDIHMEYLVKKFLDQGGKREQKEVKHFGECWAEFDEVVNCTGLGARALCNDLSIIPCRGQIVLIKNYGLNESTFDEDADPKEYAYTIARKDDIVLGGTGYFHDWNANEDPHDSEKIMKRCEAILGEGYPRDIIKTKVGLRPYRPVIRVEAETPPNPMKLVVHNYGHGGSGYTINWGTCSDAVELIKAHVANRPLRSLPQVRVPQVVIPPAEGESKTKTKKKSEPKTKKKNANKKVGKNEKIQSRL